MSEHPNVQRLEDGYAAFAKGDIAALDDLFAEDIRWQEPGRNQLSGTYEGRAAVYQLFGRVMEVTEGSFRLDVRTVLADGDDAVVVCGVTAQRGGQSLDTVNAHIWRFAGDRAVEFREASGDQHATDAVFG
ncbi:nuclear transport factor 2 family protein [Geodermatophilus sp. SYSU D00079]